MNWKFWKKKNPKCFGFHGASVMPTNVYLRKENCDMCKNDIQIKCFFKSLGPFTIRLNTLDVEHEEDLEKWR